MAAIKEETKKILDSPLQNGRIPEPLILYTGRKLLNAAEMSKFAKSCKKFEIATKEELLKRKKLSEELLHHVFQADPKKVEEYFANPNSPVESILEKTAYREGYYSEKLKLEIEKKDKKDKNAKKDKEDNFVLFRHWPNVSPLQAAAICGDNFLVKQLLSYILKKEEVTNDSSLRLKAAAQLQEILNSQHYLISFNELINAYNEFLSPFERLYSDEKYDEIDKLWEKVGECHKRLSRYGLQEFFDAKPLHPLPTFDSEPNRGKLRFLDNKLFNLDSIGLGTLLGLVKGVNSWEECGRGSWRGGNLALAAMHIDVAAIKRLYELRKAQLENKIKCLQSREAAISLISSDDNAPQKQKP